MGPIRIGVVGIGKIARDQHIPVLRSHPGFELVACASRNSSVDGVANFPSLEAMIEQRSDLDAIAICTPPQLHYQAAVTGLSHGKHVLLEKPPCSTTVQLDQLAKIAAGTDRTLFQSWHARFAPAVDAASRALKERHLRKATVIWKEDVRRWHPGQRWIWQAGGFGVFDPGINAISILTKILHDPVFVESAELFFPSNCQAPIAAEVMFRTGQNALIAASFDFRHEGEQTWDIRIETDGGPIDLTAGGSRLSIDGKMVSEPTGHPHAEYHPLYGRFAELIASSQSEVDAAPFRLVADAFLVGRRVSVGEFHE